jgi:hypothetical protein
MDLFTLAILDLGTYFAHRAADDSLASHTAACRCGIRDLASQVFLQVRGPNLRFRGVRSSRLGLTW